MSKPKTFPDGTNHRRYDVCTEKGYWLATAFIGADGVFSAVSDYGDYGHWWRSIGCDDIRQFLCGCDADYLVRKFAPETERDDEATVRAIKDCILKLRRSKSLTAEQAREEWDLVENFDSPDVWYHETNLHQVTDVAELGRSRYKPQAVSFCEKVMPRLCEMLRAEMAAEQAQTAPEKG